MTEKCLHRWSRVVCFCFAKNLFLKRCQFKNFFWIQGSRKLKYCSYQSALLKTSALSLRGKFFSYVWSTFLFICSTWTTDVQNILEKPEPRPKNQRPEPGKHTKEPLRIFFITMRLVFEIIFIEPTVPPSIFWYFATEWIKGPLLHFRHCDIVQNSQFLSDKFS